jgi:hypothetical protein
MVSMATIATIVAAFLGVIRFPFGSQTRRTAFPVCCAGITRS